MSRITRPIADEDTIKMVGYFVDWVIVWEGSDTRASADQTSKYVLDTVSINLQKPKVRRLTFFNATIDNSNVKIPMG